jgi:hypothetical protein
LLLSECKFKINFSLYKFILYEKKLLKFKQLQMTQNRLQSMRY